MLYAVSALLTAVVCWPLFGGYLLHRDAVATPQSPLTATALGIDGTPPRAVPQDAVMAVASHLVDGGLLLAALTTAALFAAGVGYGRLARRLVPSAGQVGAVAAAIVAIWNPFVAERLLQGHWSLLAGYAALGWIVCAMLDVVQRPGWRSWAGLAGRFAVAGFTPTGSLYALITVAVAAAGIWWQHRRASDDDPALRGRTVVGVSVAWLLTASPWLVAAAVSGSSGTDVSGARTFAPRAEPGLGTFGSLLGLGGIWNADAVPASRTSPWAVVATVCLVALIAFGTVVLHRRGGLTGVAAALGVAAAVVLALTVVAATGLGLDAFDAVLRTVPGAGLFRDSQKYLALTMPFIALAVAAAAGRLRTWVPAGFAIAAVALLVVAPLPDLAWGVGGKLRPIHYPSDYAAVTALIGHSDAAVAVWPADTMRRYPWNNGPSLSPLPRMIDAPVVYGGELIVDGETVDAPPPHFAPVVEALTAGHVDALRRLGVGWVVVERGARAGQPPAPDLSAAVQVYRGPELTVYRINHPAAWPAPSDGARVASLTAHALWAVCLLVGIVAAARIRRRSAA